MSIKLMLTPLRILRLVIGRIVMVLECADLSVVEVWDVLGHYSVANARHRFLLVRIY